MGIFQKSVINKHLKTLDDKKVKVAYEQFKEFYGNKIRLHNIMQLKEENYQEGFLREVFVDTLGYIINPNENYNLTTEYKNLKDARKADGAILKNGKAIGVIELKSTKTKNLESIKEQAFGYKNNQPGCKYVITSNFQKLRLYIDNSTEYEEFDLFNLEEKDFAVFWLLLSKESLFNDLPGTLKKETKFHENNISDKLYADYKSFKNRIFENLVKNNTRYDKLELFKKSQKLLDRFLFVLFAEDSGLIPPNTISKIIEQWKQLQELDEYMSLYSRFQKLFAHLDKGHTYKKWGELPAYNGGLFREDEILDDPETGIDDEILEKDSLNLSRYDFNTEVDVNILGHIFEHSLNEIEQISAKLKGEAIDKKKTKRKKDGIFYTPKYITKYIVENTVGTLCKEKKQELDIDNLLIDETYRKTDGKLKKKGKQLFDTLNTYKKWLLELKILDPACGSGAFLNQTLDFLMTEHQEIDDRIAELEGKTDTLRLHDTDKSILESNIYGVDINEESVEIAKLALWLRTAQRGRPLSDLSGNIKCGNSLIDDPEIAGDKAFDWNVEFKEIMDKGGFDVVIGNPPYVRLQGLKANYEKESFYYEQNYKSATSNYDIYVLFLEKSFALIKEKGLVSYILPHKFLISEFGKGIREFFAERKAVESLLHFGSEMVFADASTYTCIINLSAKNETLKFKQINPKKITEPFKFDTISYEKINADKWNLKNAGITDVLEKLYQQPLRVKDVFAKIFQGIATSGDNVYMIKGKQAGNYVEGYSKALARTVKIETGLMKPMLKGEDISKYRYLQNQYFVIFPYLIEEGKAQPMTESYINEKFPLGYEYLKENEIALRSREKGRMDKEGWFLYIYPKSLTEFEQPKIITPDISLGSNMSFDKGKFYHGTTLYSFIKNAKFSEDYKFWLSIFNSKIMWCFIKNTGTELRGGYFRFKTKYIEPFPLPQLKDISEQDIFIEKADQMLSLNKDLQEKTERFLKRLRSNFEIEKFSQKLQNFYAYDFKTLLAELKKQKIKLSLTAQDEWEEYFDSYKKEINALQSQISQTDQEIDQMVYELYGLTEEEIAIVEESVK